jgi:hypothetical protein
MAALTKSEAKKMIIQEWKKWAARRLPSRRRASGDDGMTFYQYLLKEHPELLNFKTEGGDPWQTVHEWLLQERKVTD